MHLASYPFLIVILRFAYEEPLVVAVSAIAFNSLDETAITNVQVAPSLLGKAFCPKAGPIEEAAAL